MKKTTAHVSLCVIALLVGAALNLQAQSWSFTGNMQSYRTWHTATLVPNGQVLVAGGRGIGLPNQSTAELYNPSTGSFTSTGSMTTGRVYHAAALLPNGLVLIVGGEAKVGVYITCLASAELYNPSTGTFTATGSLNTTACVPTATLLNNGKVLVVGSDAELYDPSTGTFSATGSLNTPRALQTATLLANGEVLIAGGNDSNGAYLASAELYNPTTGTFTVTGSMHTSRDYHAATLLPNGQVLIAGGQTYTPPRYPILSSAELYNPSTGKFTVTGSMNTARDQHTAVLLPSGEVLEASGYPTKTAELYNPASGTFSYTASENVERDAGAGTLLLNNGVVLTTGGHRIISGKPYFTNTAELYH